MASFNAHYCTILISSLFLGVGGGDINGDIEREKPKVILIQWFLIRYIQASDLSPKEYIPVFG